MVSIPHPCSEQQAKDWITAHTDAFAQGKSVIFAIESKQELQLIGTAGLRDIDQGHCRGEMGLWIGVEWWGRGYATEAARAMLDHGFESLRFEPHLRPPHGQEPGVWSRAREDRDDERGPASAASSEVGQIRGRFGLRDFARRLVESAVLIG